LLSRTKVGLVGAGYWGTKLAREYVALSRADSTIRFTALADRSAVQIVRVQSILGSNHLDYFLDYRHLLGQSRVDAVHIAVPNEQHYIVASEFLQNGVHVLLEKPMALTSREAFDLVELASKQGLILQIGHVFRFSNALQEAKRLIESGLIGRPFFLNICWSNYQEPPEGRNIIFDLAPHPIDILNMLLGEWPLRVSTTARAYLKKSSGLEDTAFISLEYPEDVIANILLSWARPGPKERSLSISGERGSLFVDALNEKLTMYDYNNGARIAKVNPNNTIYEMIGHFVKSASEPTPPLNGGLAGAHNVRVLEACVQSLKSRARLRVAPNA